jgi:hypothetical protein
LHRHEVGAARGSRIKTNRRRARGIPEGEHIVGFDQQGKTAFNVTRNSSGKWEVCEEGFTKPIASFDEEDAARKYASDLARVKRSTRPTGKAAGKPTHH